MVAFVDAHREAYGVEPICAVLPIAPSTDFALKAQHRAPTARSARAQRDERLGETIQQLHDTHHGVNGARKVWRQLHRDAERVARCTVERLMRRLGLQGVIRGKRQRTTVRDDTAVCPLDLVRRPFVAEGPNQLWVADFTYIATWRGVVYVAFVIDVFSRRIVRWRASASMRTDPALDALKQALYDRETDAGLVHHSDTWSQYLSVRYTERLGQVGSEPAVGSRGDSYDNALAESIIGPFKTEVIRRRGPWRGLEALEFATLEWVAWYNTRRLLEPLGYVPPAEYEEAYYRSHTPQLTAVGRN